MSERARRLMLGLLATCVVMGAARLGWWQLDRAARKVALQQAIDATRQLPPLSASALPRTVDAVPASMHRAVGVQGRWLHEGTVLLDNRPLQGKAGLIVVTPLLLPDGDAVAVQRGWVPRDPQDRTRIPSIPAPQGTVQVVGRIAGEPARLLQLGEAGGGAIRQNLDLDAYARELRLRLLPFSIEQEDIRSAADDGLTRRWSPPAADIHKHYGYAFQWFALAALVVILYAWFGIIRPRRSAA